MLEVVLTFFQPKFQKFLLHSQIPLGTLSTHMKFEENRTAERKVTEPQSFQEWGVKFYRAVAHQ